MIDIEILKKHEFIVIGFEHYNPLGVIRSLGENGIRPIAIIKKSDIRIASKSKYIKKLHIVENDEEAMQILLNYYQDKHNKPFVIPCDDNITELLDVHYDELNDFFYFSNAGENGRISNYMNKKEICNLAQKNGLNVPKSWVVQIGEIPSDILYPVITKPITSYPNWKADYHICENKEELIEAYKTIKAKTLMLQSYIKKVNELCLDGIVVNHGKDVMISIASKYTYILPDYFSMEMNIFSLKDNKIKNYLSKMFEEIGYNGIFSAEFMIDDNDNLWFLEINFRNSTWSYASTKLGMNLPLLWASGQITGQIEKNDYKEIPQNYVALAEVDDFEHRVKRLKMISPITWAKGVIRADCLFYWNIRDIKPVMSYWFGKISRFINKKIGRYSCEKKR